MTVRIATLAYPIERLESFDAFAEKQTRLVQEAVDNGARLVLFPEYGSMELGSLVPGASLDQELGELAPFWPRMHALYRELATHHHVDIVAPSAPEPHAGGYVNRARIFSPAAREGAQEKLLMTRFEREEWNVSAGAGQTVFDTGVGPVGIAICYDSEFPMLVRRLVDAGARIILVPSCTDTLAGYHRVALSCRARALENQCFVVQASTVGHAPWSRTVDENHGLGAVYGPVDRGFASDGVVAQGPLDVPGFTYAELSLEALETVRREGQVRNHEDWDRPAHLISAPVERIALG